MNNEPVAWNYDNGKWEVCVDGYAVWLDSDDFTHDASLQVAGDFVDLPQKFAYAEEIAKRLNNSLYTHPHSDKSVKAKTEDEGKVCARCGAIAYDPVITQTAKTLTDEEIEYLLRESIWALGLNSDCLEQENWDDAITVFRSILRKAQEK